MKIKIIRRGKKTRKMMTMMMIKRMIKIKMMQRIRSSKIKRKREMRWRKKKNEVVQVEK